MAAARLLAGGLAREAGDRADAGEAEARQVRLPDWRDLDAAALDAAMAQVPGGGRGRGPGDRCPRMLEFRLFRASWTTLLPLSAHDARTAAVRDNGRELASMHAEASRLSSFSGRAGLEALRRWAGGEGQGRRQG